MVYKTLNNNENVILADYVRAYKYKNKDAKILIGADSQNTSTKTIYVVVVALYTEGKGAHLVYNKWKEPRERSTPTRLLKEVWSAVECAEYLKEKFGYDEIGMIDIDLNPDPKYKSNQVFRQAVGLVEGMGYKVRTKHKGAMITYAADHLAKH